MKKYAKKLLALAMVLAMVLSLGVSAYALTDDDGTYTQVALANAPTISGTTTVYISLISDRVYDVNGNLSDDNGDYFQMTQYDLPVVIGTTGVTNTYYVSDVMAAAELQYSWLGYLDVHNQNGSTYLYSIEGLYDGGNGTTDTAVFSPAEYELEDAMYYFEDADDFYTQFYAYLQYNQNGWMFRINDKIPLLNSADRQNNSSEYGAAENQAYVQGGDSITFYYCDIYEGDNYDEELGDVDENTYVLPTKYLKWDEITYNPNSGNLTAKAYSSELFSEVVDINYFDVEWNLSNIDFVQFTDGVEICIDGYNNTFTPTVTNGVYSVNVGSLSSGRHVLAVVPSSELTHTVNEEVYGFNDFVGATVFVVP